MNNITIQTQQVVSQLSGSQNTVQSMLSGLNSTGLGGTSANFLNLLTSILGNSGETALASQLKKSAETLGTQLNAEMLSINPLLGLMLSGQATQADLSTTQQTALLDALGQIQSLNTSQDRSLVSELLVQFQQSVDAIDPLAVENTAIPTAFATALQTVTNDSDITATTITATVTSALDDASVLQGQSQFGRAINQAQQLLKATDSTETADVTEIDFDELQKKVDSGTFLSGLSNVNSMDTPAAVAENTTPLDAQEILSQIKTAVTQHDQGGTTDFTIKLSPEGLGEITVKLLADGEKMTLSLTATNANVQRLLGSELNNLRDIMRPYNVEVSQVVQTNEAQNMNMQQFGQQSSQHSYTGQQQNNAFYAYAPEYGESAVNSEQPQTVVLPGSALDAYI